MASVGGGAVLLGGDAEALGQRLRGEGREFVDTVGLFQQFGRVAVKADSVPAAGAAVELVRGGCVGAWFAKRVVALEDADQRSVRVVEKDQAVAGQVVGGLFGELLGNGTALESWCLDGGGEGSSGGGPGNLLAGGEAVPEPCGGVGSGQGGLDVEDAVDAAAASAAVAHRYGSCREFVAELISAAGGRAS